MCGENSNVNLKIMQHFWGILVFLLTLTSCGTLRVNNTSDFSTISEIKDLEGYYLNRTNNGSILSCFNIREYADFVTLTSDNPNEIKLTYYNSDSLTKQERIFPGTMKKKYFEIYFSKLQFFIPLIYGIYDIDRIRIGKTKDGKLLIRNLEEKSGHWLVIGGGYSVETPFVFSCAKEYKGYIPTHENGLWGYSDSSGTIVIPGKYDFASIFETDVARVKLNNKWGLINRQGEEITSVKYDRISRIDTLSYPPIFRANIGEKAGFLDTNGHETVPVIYDYIGRSIMSPDRLFHIQLGDKKGFADRTQVVIPAIYSETLDLNEKKVAGKRDGTYFIMDMQGYEYEVKRSILGLWNAKPETKRKILFEEPHIE